MTSENNARMRTREMRKETDQESKSENMYFAVILFIYIHTFIISSMRNIVSYKWQSNVISTTSNVLRKIRFNRDLQLTMKLAKVFEYSYRDIIYISQNYYVCFVLLRKCNVLYTLHYVCTHTFI